MLLHGCRQCWSGCWCCLRGGGRSPWCWACCKPECGRCSLLAALFRAWPPALSRSRAHAPQALNPTCAQTVLEQLLVLLARGREVTLVLGLLEAFVHLGNKRTVACQMHRVAAAMAPRMAAVLEHLSVPRPNSIPGARAASVAHDKVCGGQPGQLMDAESHALAQLPSSSTSPRPGPTAAPQSRHGLRNAGLGAGSGGRATALDHPAMILLMAHLCCAGWSSPDPGGSSSAGDLSREAGDEACAMSSLMQAVVDVPELLAAAPHAQLISAAPFSQMLGCAACRRVLTSPGAIIVGAAGQVQVQVKGQRGCSCACACSHLPCGLNVDLGPVVRLPCHCNDCHR